MPGSKRRALKKLLSPNSPSPVSPLSNSPGTTSLDSSIPSPSPVALPASVDPESVSAVVSEGISPEQIQESVILEEMTGREKEIGTHTAPPELAASPPARSESRGLYGTDVGSGTGMYGNGGGGKKKKSSRQRFEERQARKQDAFVNMAPPSDPNWTAQLERERQEEIQVVSDACAALDGTIHEIAPDGHCMYSAIGDQLGLIGLISADEAKDPKAIRRYAAMYMLNHPDDFMPFLPSITGEDSAGATDDGLMTPAGFNKYCQMVSETGEWGGEPEIQALSRAFNVPIHVIQRGPPTIVSHGGAEDSFGGASTAEQSKKLGERVVRISYHRRMYGLGEHYNSLRPAN